MRAFSLINTLLLLCALSKVSRIKIHLLYQICCIKMEGEFQKYEAEINSGSEDVDISSSEDEESHYDDLLGPRGSPSVQPYFSFSSVSTTPISMGPATNLGLDLFSQPFSSDSDGELTTLQPIRPASYANVEQQQSPQLQFNYPTIQTFSDIPSTSTTRPRVGRPPSRRWRRGRPRMSRSPRNQQTSPIQMSPATTPTPPISSPLPSAPQSPSPVWDENESGHPPKPIPFTGQSRHYLEEPGNIIGSISIFGQ
ncbi:uncharacterized protein LOC144425272 [Styela clava]